MVARGKRKARDLRCADMRREFMSPAFLARLRREPKSAPRPFNRAKKEAGRLGPASDFLIPVFGCWQLRSNLLSAGLSYVNGQA
jgi:hypothetical protein